MDLTSEQRDLTARRLLPVAAEIARLARTGQPDQMHARVLAVPAGDLPAVVCLLAAMVPIHMHTPAQLLAWTDHLERTPA